MSTTTMTTDGLVSAAQGADSVSAGQMLKMIFGNVADNPLAALTSLDTGNTALSVIFMYINIGLLTLGSVYLTYKTLAAITQTAHDGDFIGKAFHTVWVPIRVTTGVLSLVPIAGGWNALQIVMLWIGVMGAGLGNLGWQAVVTGWLENGTGGHTVAKNSVTATVMFGNGMTVAEKAFIGALCVEAQVATGSSAGVNPLLFQTYRPDGSKGAYCGEISIASQSKVSDSVSRQTKDPQIGTLAVQVENATKLLTEKMVGDMRAIAKDAVAQVVQQFLDAQNPDAPLDTPLPNFTAALAKVHFASQIYQEKLNLVVTDILNKASAQDHMSKIVNAAARDYGFVSAGSFYTAYANSSYSLKSLSDTSSMVDVKLDEDHNNDVWKSTQRYLESAKQLAAPSSSSPSESDSSQGAFKLLQSKMGFVSGDNMVSAFIRNDPNTPALVNIKNTADYAVWLASAGITATGALQGAKDSVIGKIADNATGGVVLGAVTPWLKMAEFVFEISFGFFLMCSIYLPLVPFIVYMGQVFEWLASVILGVAAAPFLAFAHFDTDGEGLGQRTAHGYTFMLQSFMRPIMLVLGFMVASVMIEVSILFLTTMFPFAVADAQVNSISGLFSVFGYCALYMVLAVGVINTSCSLMYLLPDTIFKFMGAESVGLGTGRDTAQHASQSVLAGVAITRQPGGDGQIISGGKEESKSQKESKSQGVIRVQNAGRKEF